MSSLTPIESNHNLCSLCREDYKDEPTKTRVSLACQHIFHKACVEPWINRHHTCPVLTCGKDSHFVVVVPFKDFFKTTARSLVSQIVDDYMIAAGLWLTINTVDKYGDMTVDYLAAPVDQAIIDKHDIDLSQWSLSLIRSNNFDLWTKNSIQLTGYSIVIGLRGLYHCAKQVKVRWDDSKTGIKILPPLTPATPNN